MVLRRYWLEFKASDAPFGLALGCGVTAFDIEDALRLVTRATGGDLPPPSRVVEDVDVATLDRGHVLANMYPPSERGIWFPMLEPYR